MSLLTLITMLIVFKEGAGKSVGQAVVSSQSSNRQTLCVRSVSKIVGDTTVAVESILTNLTFIQDTLGFRDFDRPLRINSSLICVGLTFYDVDKIIGLVVSADELSKSIATLSEHKVIDDLLTVLKGDSGTEAPITRRETSTRSNSPTKDLCVEYVIRTLTTMKSTLDSAIQKLTALEDVLGFRDSALPAGGSALICGGRPETDVLRALIVSTAVLSDRIDALSSTNIVTKIKNHLGYCVYRCVE